MKKIIQFSALCLLLSLCLMASVTYGSVNKPIRIGKFWNIVNDNVQQATPEAGFGWYYHNNNGFAGGWGVNTHRTTGIWFACKDWTDPADGTTYEYMVAGSGHSGPNEFDNMIPIPDKDDGLTIHKYWRYDPPVVIVDNVRSSDVLREGEIVDRTYIERTGGTAENMIESITNTRLGITIHQRVYAWSQQNHDDYIIYDWTLINTGNIDGDDEIESTQTIKDFYMMKGAQITNSWMTYHMWPGATGELKGDTLRATYVYPARSHQMTAEDLMGDVSTAAANAGWMNNPWTGGDATLFCSSGANMTAVADDDWSQPRVTDCFDQEWNKFDACAYNDADRQLVYKAASEGFLNITSNPRYDDALLAYPGTFHGITVDELCLYGLNIKYPDDADHFTVRSVLEMSYGPFTLEHGDSIRIVIARGCGSISPEKNWEVGQAWYNGTADAVWTGDWYLPPANEVFPDLSPTDNDKAKDSWVMTGVDSFYMNMYNAQWNFKQGYQIPTAPPPPSLTVTSCAGYIRLEWGEESEAAADLAGYRIYRAQGNPGPTVAEGQLIGSWELIETVGSGTHTYDDETAERGQAYYYAVCAIDDGTNIPDVSGEDGQLLYPADQVLESGLYLNRTVVAAKLLRQPGGKLEDIRVVPNPFNISAINRQYTGTESNSIKFLELPPECTIRIFTEGGELIQTIEHTNGSGDETWGGVVPERHSATTSGQRVVSGIYIAHIEKPSGESIIRKFVIVR